MRIGASSLRSSNEVFVCTVARKCVGRVMHTMKDFRFLQTYGCVVVQIISVAALDAQQEVAKQNVERAQLDDVLVPIKREETNWTTYCKAIEA